MVGKGGLPPLKLRHPQALKLEGLMVGKGGLPPLKFRHPQALKLEGLMVGKGGLPRSSFATLRHSSLKVSWSGRVVYPLKFRHTQH
jgi:hypothetical protein